MICVLGRIDTWWKGNSGSHVRHLLRDVDAALKQGGFRMEASEIERVEFVPVDGAWKVVVYAY
jgi:hypothetical protein